MPLFAATASRSEVIRNKAFHFISQLGIRYEPGEFVCDDPSPQAARAWRDGLTAGHRAPNGLATRDVDVFRLVDGYRFDVLAMSRAPLARDEIDEILAELAALPHLSGLELQTHVVAYTLTGRDERIVRAENNQAFNHFGITPHAPRGLFLVRPDGYLAYRSDRWDVEGLKRFLLRFGPPQAP